MTSTKTWTADLQLVQGVINRDPSSWAMFLERFGPMIHARVRDVATAFRQEGNRDDVERVTLYVLRSLIARDAAALRAFQSQSSLASYLAVASTRVAKRAFVRGRLAKLQREQGGASGLQCDGSV